MPKPIHDQPMSNKQRKARHNERLRQRTEVAGQAIALLMRGGNKLPPALRHEYATLSGRLAEFWNEDGTPRVA